jgi:hypothetical protein
MWQKLFQKRYSLLLLVVYIVALYVILNQAVVPFVLSVVNSDLFAGDPSAGGEPIQVHDERTQVALLQCNRFVQDKLGEEAALAFEDKAYQAWDIGYGRFLIKSQVTVTDKNQTVRKNYVCELKHTGGDLAEPANWKLQGLSLTDASAGT